MMDNEVEYCSWDRVKYMKYVCREGQEAASGRQKLPSTHRFLA